MCIPPCVGEGLTALETLLLARNRLHFLPDAVRPALSPTLHSMRRALSLAVCLGVQILSFQQLRVLDVSANQVMRHGTLLCLLELRYPLGGLGIRVQLNSTMPALTRGRPQLDAFPDLYASMPICLSLRVVNIAQNRIRILQACQFSHLTRTPPRAPAPDRAGQPTCTSSAQTKGPAGRLGPPPAGARGAGGPCSFSCASLVHRLLLRPLLVPSGRPIEQ
jgi:hypothetical protein